MKRGRGMVRKPKAGAAVAATPKGAVRAPATAGVQGQEVKIKVKIKPTKGGR